MRIFPVKRYLRIDGVPTEIQETFGNDPPGKLYKVLFHELCRIDITSMTITYLYGEPREGQIGHGYFGTEHAGIRWTEGYSTVTPMYVSHVSYGLPEIQLYWEYQWHRGGHAPSTFDHTQLEIALGNERMAEHFTRIWLQVFGQAPILTDLVPDTSNTLEKRLIARHYNADHTDFKLARDKTTPPETLAQLAAKTSDMGVLYLIATNLNTTGQVLNDLWQHPRVAATREAVERSPYGRTGPFFGSDEDFLERLEFAIAGHLNTPADMLSALGQSKNPNIRWAVKRNSHFRPDEDEKHKGND
jgi:hypothetical protein